MSFALTFENKKRFKRFLGLDRKPTDGEMIAALKRVREDLQRDGVLPDDTKEFLADVGINGRADLDATLVSFKGYDE